MKTLLGILLVFVMSFASISYAGFEDDFTCDTTVAGGDVWPWCVALPFPWEEIEGYWRLGNDKQSYLQARLERAAEGVESGRKILKIYLHNDGICSKAYAVGTGSIYPSEKNVMQGLVSSYLYRYQLKIALFDSRDLEGYSGDQPSVMGMSVWVIGETERKPVKKIEKNYVMVDKSAPVHNKMIKKITLDVDKMCNSIR